MLQDWANGATVATAIVALLALLGAIVQISVGRQNQREATASTLYGNYLALAVQYPQLASGLISMQATNAPTNPEFERYEWFVSMMLHAFEQILDLARHDRIWRGVLSDQFAYHREYFESGRFVAEHYSPELCELLRKRIHRSPSV